MFFGYFICFKELNSLARSVLGVRMCNAGEEKKMVSIASTRRNIFVFSGQGVWDGSCLEEKVNKSLSGNALLLFWEQF